MRSRLSRRRRSEGSAKAPRKLKARRRRRGDRLRKSAQRTEVLQMDATRLHNPVRQ